MRALRVQHLKCYIFFFFFFFFFQNEDETFSFSHFERCKDCSRHRSKPNETKHTSTRRKDRKERKYVQIFGATRNVCDQITTVATNCNDILGKISNNIKINIIRLID